VALRCGHRNLAVVFTNATASQYSFNQVSELISSKLIFFDIGRKFPLPINESGVQGVVHYAFRGEEIHSKHVSHRCISETDPVRKCHVAGSAFGQCATGIDEIECDVLGLLRWHSQLSRGRRNERLDRRRFFSRTETTPDVTHPNAAAPASLQRRSIEGECVFSCTHLSCGLAPV
jgi:hypothetical protein